MSETGTLAEKLFADICSAKYLNGFVFHSPKVRDPTEIEVGDVVIWVRTQLIVFEMISRKPDSSANLTSFIKRIGSKRDQLQRDYDFFSSLEHDIMLTNEDGNDIVFRQEYFVKQGFVGIALVDIGSDELKLHHGTIEKCLEINFPVHVLHYGGFLKVIHELDTVADVYFYLLDRARFLPFLFSYKPDLLLQLTEDFEPNLLAFYKMHENSFPEDEFDFDTFSEYWSQYQSDFKNHIKARDAENEDSYIIDRIIQHILAARTETNDETIFAWELATLTRRQRATYLTEKVADAFYRLKNGNEKRFFSYFNKYTACWILFFFNYGGTTTTFRTEFERLLRLKTIYEASNKGFTFSTFGYGFRKSALETPNSLFDDFAMTIQDVDDLGPVTREELKEANELFGHSREVNIKEFPDTEKK